MKGYEELNHIENNYALSQFCGLCDRAKGYLFDWLLSEERDGALHAIYNNGVLNSQLTPIEQIFNICFHRYVDENVTREKLYDIGIPLNIALQEELIVQEEIECGTHKYIADFVIDFSRKDSEGSFLYPKLKGLKYVIELDGIKYHSNKNQVNHDYEREQLLQMAGYKVVRFTGSQIYNEPYSCIHKLLLIIFNDMREVAKNGSY